MANKIFILSDINFYVNLIIYSFFKLLPICQSCNWLSSVNLNLLSFHMFFMDLHNVRKINKISKLIRLKSKIFAAGNNFLEIFSFFFNQ